MIDICMALDQSVSPHTGVRTIQNTGVFWQAVFQLPRPYSLFLEHGSAAAKTLISHAHNTASYAGQKFNISVCVLFLLLSRAFASRARTLHAHPRDNPKGLFGP